MASTVPPCGRGSVQPLWDSTKGRYVEVECPHASRVERLQMRHVYAIDAIHTGNTTIRVRCGTASRF